MPPLSQFIYFCLEGQAAEGSCIWVTYDPQTLNCALISIYVQRLLESEFPQNMKPHYMVKMQVAQEHVCSFLKVDVLVQSVNPTPSVQNDMVFLRIDKYTRCSAQIS